MSNSIKYTEQGYVKIKGIYDRYNDEIQIIVEDTGVGIDFE